MRSPNQWAEAQRAFHHEYDADPTPFERFDVHYRYRFTDAFEVAGGGGVGGLLFTAIEHLVHLHPSEPEAGDHADVALWPIDAQLGDHALLWFETTPESCRDLPHVGVAALVGEPAPNGALCLEVGDRTVWPTYNPREPADWVHGWDRG